MMTSRPQIAARSSAYIATLGPGVWEADLRRTCRLAVAVLVSVSARLGQSCRPASEGARDAQASWAHARGWCPAPGLRRPPRAARQLCRECLPGTAVLAEAGRALSCVPHSVTWRTGARSTPTTVRPSQQRCIYKRAHAHWLCVTLKQAACTLAVSGLQASSL